MTFRKITFIGAIVLIIITGFFTISYIKHLTYIERLNNDSEKLLKLYQSFNYNYYDITPRNLEDFNNMLNWTRKTSDSSSLDLFFLENGFNVSYDSIEKSSIIYSYGKDKEDNHLSNKLYNTKGKLPVGKQIIKSLGFFDYFKNFLKDKDVALIKITNSKFDCKSAINNSEKNPLFLFQLYNKDENLWVDKNSRIKFLKLIGDFQRKFSNKQSEVNFSKQTKVYVKYKKGDIEILCGNSFDINKLSELKSSLKDYLNSVEHLFFDYSIFSVDITY